jgi:hypothetical protein
MEAAAEVKPLLADYFDQIFQVPPVICGRQLKVLSVGRYRLMSRFKVAFVDDQERAATAGDLLMAVLICSMRVDEFMAFASQPDFSAQVQKWGRKAGFFEPKMFSWPCLGQRLKKFLGSRVAEVDLKYLTTEIQRFQEYIIAGSRAPEYWDESPEAHASSAHWSQSIEVVLRGNIGWTMAEINEEPLGKALWDYFKFMENQGTVLLMSPEEVQANATPLSEADAAEAKAAAEKALAFLRGETGGQNGQ